MHRAASKGEVRGARLLGRSCAEDMSWAAVALWDRDQAWRSHLDGPCVPVLHSSGVPEISTNHDSCSEACLWGTGDQGFSVPKEGKAPKLNYSSSHGRNLRLSSNRNVTLASVYYSEYFRET